jgi:transcription initiation factor TFIIIB Brf1 subunit/transcription initiation factor TFIIB
MTQLPAFWKKSSWWCKMAECTIQKCPECKGKVVLTNGVYVCEDCGLVAEPDYVPQDYIISVHTDKHELAKQYVSPGERVDIVDGMGSYIGNFNETKSRDSHGNTLSKEKELYFRRLNRIYNFRARIRHKESQYRVLKSLNHAAVLLQLSDETKQRAAYIYRKSLKEFNKKELTHPVLISAALFLAIRERREPVTLQEIISVFGQLGHRIPAKKVLRGIEILKKAPGIELVRRTSEDYIPCLASKVVRHPEVKVRLHRRFWTPTEYHSLLTRTATLLLEEIAQEQRGGRHPYIFAVSVLYGADLLIARQSEKCAVLTQKLLATITNVAEYSIRDHYCSVLKHYVKGEQKIKVAI